MNTAYFDCSSGISGDMCLGALIHAGADFQEMEQQLSLLPIEGFSLSRESTRKKGITATKIQVKCHGHHHHRGLEDILRIIDKSSLSHRVKEQSGLIFSRLAKAEAEVHGLPVNEVHFHEVGAVDAIVDIVGTVLCLAQLQIEKIISSPLPLGHGFIDCAHGLLPLPAPATQMLLKGIPVYGVDIEGELVTPTGAAIVSTLASSFGPAPLMTVNSLGYGAGEKDFGIPNILRVSVGQEAFQTELEEIEVLETTVDDMSPEIFSYLWEKIFKQGALDMFLTSVQMKKGRPGTLITVLCHPNKRSEIFATLVAETTTLGIRIRREQRFCCPRKIIQISTKYGEVKVKVGEFQGITKMAPEYEDCRLIANKHQVPLKEVFQEILTALRCK